MLTVFHLKNKEAKHELKVNHNDEALPFYSDPKYFRVTLDRSLMYWRHLASLRKKLKSRVVLFGRLAGSGWAAAVTTLRTSTLARVHSTAEYCAPVCCRSAHTCLMDLNINYAFRTVTGYLLPKPADNFPILADIQPVELRRKRVTLSV